MSRTSSDLDFGDVFGGPPRRSGLYERQRSRADSFDSSSYPRRRGGGEEERLATRQGLSSSPGLVEKPVFGELDVPSRRPHLSDDFFDDIYTGSDQSGNSTPRRADQDVFSPTPGSRILSPNRHGSSLLPRHSLPVKVVKGVEYPFRSAGLQNSAFKMEDVDALDVEEVLSSQDEPKSSRKFFNKQSTLAKTFSQDIDETSSMESQFQKDRISLESYISSNQFHFSIYKWAGKGVSLNVSSKWKEGIDPVSRLRRLAEVVIQSVDLPYDDDKPEAPTNAYNNQNRKKDTNSTMIKDTLPPESSPKHSGRDLTENSGMMNSNNKDVPASTPYPIKPEFRNLTQLFNEDSEDQESLTGGQKNQLDTKDNYKAKRQTQEVNRMEHTEASVIHDTKDFPGISEDKLPGKKVKEKVKGFIKIFSQGGSPKHKTSSETEDKKPKGKERTKSNEEEQISTLTTKKDEEMKDTYTKKASATAELNKTSREDEILHSPSDVNTTDEDSYTGRGGNLEQGSEPIKESINISACNIGESPCEDFEGCLVQQVGEDLNESLQAESEKDQIKAADVKIREWSKGKEGNIRSLLSTLQYVLWPESGWKPVPLVNIIEGSSVKRAYQKALLCLHPDKLQQRGAAMHQKYLAEKVFDILQEAWDQFNSLSGF